MSTRTVCDCGCTREVIGADAGHGPTVIEAGEVELVVMVRGTDGQAVNVNRGCILRLAQRGTLQGQADVVAIRRAG